MPLKLPQRRPKGLGLGADINMGRPNGKKVSSNDGENSDVRPLKKSSYVKITGGAYRYWFIVLIRSYGRSIQEKYTFICMASSHGYNRDIIK